MAVMMHTQSTKIERMKKAVNALISDIKSRTFPADKIILFGSIAKDCIHERSDMDICIVSEEELTIPQKREIENYFFDMVQDEFVPDFVYCNIDTLKTGTQVFSSIRNEGKVLYERV